jgi:ankyrin repeat protein
MRNFNLTVFLVTLVIISNISIACKSSTEQKKLDITEQKKLDIKLCGASFNGDLVKIKALLAKGAEPNTTQCGEFSKVVGYPTPLFFALLGYDKSAQDLLAGNQIYDTRDNDRQRLTVMALLAAGANPNTKSKTKAKETPLMYAEFLKSSSLVRALTEAGADPNIRDTQGRIAKDYGAITGEELRQMASHNNIARLFIVIAQKDATEKDIVNEVVPKK